MQRAEHGRNRLLVRPLAFEGQETVIERLEVLARVLEVDGEQLGETWKSDMLAGGRPSPLLRWS